MSKIYEGTSKELIIELFLAYKARQKGNCLYLKEDNQNQILNPVNLIKLYYLNFNDISLNNIKKAFITRYVKNESELEGVSDTKIHSSIEMQGLLKMYEYIHSKEIDQYDLSVYDIKELNRLLFSTMPNKDSGGHIRNFNGYLYNTNIELSDYSYINQELYYLDNEMVIPLNKIAAILQDQDVKDEVPLAIMQELEQLGESPNKYTGNLKIDAMLAYADAVVVLGCKLIKVHPFFDGNGRSIRGFMNKLFEKVGFPPVYIKTSERKEYQKAMQSALQEIEYGQDYTAIKQFYHYKICDSIIELDINNRVKKDYETLKVKNN